MLSAENKRVPEEPARCSCEWRRTDQLQSDREDAMIRLDDVPVIDDHAHVAMMEQREGSLITPLRGQLQAFHAADIQSASPPDVWERFEPAWTSGVLRRSRSSEADPMLVDLLKDAEKGRDTTAYS